MIVNKNLVDHPLIKHKISILRDINTGTKEFREVINEIAMLLVYEGMKNESLIEGVVETPITNCPSYKLDENKYAFVPIIRAGLGIADGVTKVIPNAKIGHIGLCRDEETLLPDKYYYKIPDNISTRTVFILDPMLATGGSAVAAIKLLKNDGVKNIKFLSIISVPEGIKKINEEHPDVEIITSAIDSHLNENGYIVPGLGDAGDRIFGTKIKG